MYLHSAEVLQHKTVCRQLWNNASGESYGAMGLDPTMWVWGYTSSLLLNTPFTFCDLTVDLVALICDWCFTSLNDITV